MPFSASGVGESGIGLPRALIGAVALINNSILQISRLDPVILLISVDDIPELSASLRCFDIKRKQYLFAICALISNFVS